MVCMVRKLRFRSAFSMRLGFSAFLGLLRKSRPCEQRGGFITLCGHRRPRLHRDTESSAQKPLAHHHSVLNTRLTELIGNGLCDFDIIDKCDLGDFQLKAPWIEAGLSQNREYAASNGRISQLDCGNVGSQSQIRRAGGRMRWPMDPAGQSTSDGGGAAPRSDRCGCNG